MYLLWQLSSIQWNACMLRHRQQTIGVLFNIWNYLLLVLSNNHWFIHKQQCGEPWLLLRLWNNNSQKLRGEHVEGKVWNCYIQFMQGICWNHRYRFPWWLLRMEYIQRLVPRGKAMHVHAIAGAIHRQKKCTARAPLRVIQGNASIKKYACLSLCIHTCIHAYARVCAKHMVLRMVCSTA